MRVPGQKFFVPAINLVAGMARSCIKAIFMRAEIACKCKKPD